MSNRINIYLLMFIVICINIFEKSECMRLEKHDMNQDADSNELEKKEENELELKKICEIKLIGESCDGSILKLNDDIIKQNVVNIKTEFTVLNASSNVNIYHVKKNINNNLRLEKDFRSNYNQDKLNNDDFKINNSSMPDVKILDSNESIPEYFGKSMNNSENSIFKKEFESKKNESQLDTNNDTSENLSLEKRKDIFLNKNSFKLNFKDKFGNYTQKNSSYTEFEDKSNILDKNSSFKDFNLKNDVNLFSNKNSSLDEVKNKSDVLIDENPLENIKINQQDSNKTLSTTIDVDNNLFLNEQKLIDDNFSSNENSIIHNFLNETTFKENTTNNSDDSVLNNINNESNINDENYLSNLQTRTKNSIQDKIFDTNISSKDISIKKNEDTANYLKNFNKNSFNDEFEKNDRNLTDNDLYELNFFDSLITYNITSDSDVMKYLLLIKKDEIIFVNVVLYEKAPNIDHNSSIRKLPLLVEAALADFDELNKKTIQASINNHNDGLMKKNPLVDSGNKKSTNYVESFSIFKIPNEFLLLKDKIIVEVNLVQINASIYAMINLEVFSKDQNEFSKLSTIISISSLGVENANKIYVSFDDKNLNISKNLFTLNDDKGIEEVSDSKINPKYEIGKYPAQKSFLKSVINSYKVIGKKRDSKVEI